MPDKITVKALFDVGKRFLSAHERYGVPEHEYRYYSYNICREHFDNWVSLDEEQDSMILFTYLASWGMIRGSSSLLQKSPYGLKNTVRALFDYDKCCRNLDLFSDSYEESKCKLCNVYRVLCGALKKDKIESPTITLLSKIFLGVWGNCPAFDANLKYIFNIPDVNSVKAFKNAIDKVKAKLSDEVFALTEAEIRSELKNSEFISKSKLIDMYGFQRGIEEGISDIDDLEKMEKRIKLLKRRGTVD
ncbi:MAG: hypothetical protein IKS15_02950 [Opitutales bacterium]|nr:hypothetical protein [Opitutales bacterium]